MKFRSPTRGRGRSRSVGDQEDKVREAIQEGLREVEGGLATMMERAQWEMREAVEAALKVMQDQGGIEREEARERGELIEAARREEAREEKKNRKA